MLTKQPFTFYEQFPRFNVANVELEYWLQYNFSLKIKDNIILREKYLGIQNGKKTPIN